MSADGGKTYGVLAGFANPADLIDAANGVREAGYVHWDTYSPFPVHGLERAMGLRDTRLPWITLIAGLIGCGTAVLMQWWMNAKDYQLVISGKPFFSLPAFIPITFELTVLFSALATVAGMFFLCDLPRLFHPTFRSATFRRVTTDGFFVCIEARDAQFDPQGTADFLRSLGSTSVELLEG
jgi:hypothetical protein